MIDHDARPGPLTRCQISGSTNLHPIIDLGHQPPCGAVLTAAQLNEPETSYPLRLMLCPESGLAQLDYVVPADKVYPADYCYKAGISWPVVEAHRVMAKGIVERFGPGFVVDIGCNDGTLLKEFKALGCKVLGVEPTDIAELAEKENDVPVLQQPFTQRTAVSARIYNQGPADVITLTNVFAHMGDLGEVMRGIVRLLADRGVLVVENHYLLDVLERNQFDTIYHEHIRTYSLKPLVMLFAQYGMEVFAVERVGRYGGNIRVYVGFRGEHPVETSVAELLALEVEKKLHEPATWFEWRERVLRQRTNFVDSLYTAASGGSSVAGCSAPGRASTLLNFYGVTPDLMRYTGELQDSLKLGHCIPGCHIPIVDNKRLIEDQPDYVVLLAWHYATEIAERLRREGLRSKLVVPLPEFKVLDL